MLAQYIVEVRRQVDIGRKVGAAVRAFSLGESWVPIQHNVPWAEAYRSSKWHLDLSNRLATTDTGQTLGGTAPFGGAGPHLTQCGLDPGLPPYQVAS